MGRRRIRTRHRAGPQRLPLAGDGGINVAYGHAADMAANGYFEHQDLEGHTPAERVRAAGYRERLAGDEVVQGWMDSPGHCENIMDARFADMGVAFALGKAGNRGLYWVQDLAAPNG